MDVNGVGSVHSAFPIKQVSPKTDVRPAAPPKPATPQDQVEISAAGRMLEDLSRSPEVRAERLEQIKAAIDDGTYETAEKLDTALEKLLDEIGFDEKRV